MMNNQPAVSAIITAYNCEKYIDEALESLERQTFRDFEVILVDDGSTDRTREHMQDFATRHPEIKVQVVTGDNGGAGKARNTGMQYATGMYWIFMDADDIYEPDFLRELYTGCTENHAQISVVHSRQLDVSTNTLLDKDESVTSQFIPNSNPFSPREEAGDVLFCALRGWAWDKLILADLIRENHLSFMEIRTSNDLTFTYLALACADRVYVCDYCGYTYRVNNSQSVSGSRIRYWDAFFQAMKELQSQLQERGLYSIYRNTYLNWASDFICWQIMSLPISEAQYRKYTLLHDQGIRDLDFSQLPKDRILYSFAWELVQTIETKDYFTWILEHQNTLEAQLRGNEGKIRQINDALQQKEAASHEMSKTITWQKEALEEKNNAVRSLGQQLEALRQNCDVQQRETDRLLEENQSLQEECQNLQENCQGLQDTITKIRNSATWKLGNALLYLPKKIRDRKIRNQN